jgi:undecaprenyl-diphosphatase
MLKRLLTADAHWSERVQVAGKPGLWRTLASFFARSGDSWFWGIALGLTWLVGDVFWQTLAVRFVIAIALTAIAVFIVKFTVRRQRPAGDWGGIYRKTDPHSFPSGHAARALMLATLGLALGPLWLGLVLCLWAPIVAFARAAMGVHYLSDVIAGAVFGIALGIGLAATLPLVPLPAFIFH